MTRAQTGAILDPTAAWVHVYYNTINFSHSLIHSFSRSLKIITVLFLVGIIVLVVNTQSSELFFGLSFNCLFSILFVHFYPNVLYLRNEAR